MEKRTQNTKENIRKLLLRLELWFAPVLLIVPLMVSMIFLQEWYSRGVLNGSSAFDGELFIGLIILFGNIVVDVAFLRSVRLLRKKKNNQHSL
jgi:membrane-bound metal-dependent hydrolase YbcI (DUF457 family)